LKVLKLVSSIAVLAVMLTVLERWFNIFFLGRLYESYGLGIAAIGWLVPVFAVAAATYSIKWIVRHKPLPTDS
jgi:hypothetical protein